MSDPDRDLLLPGPVGYLVPEWPGQTHAFFRRELEVLRAANGPAMLDVVSTRRPAPGLQSHAWTADEASRTQYLVPLRWARVIRGLLAAGPVGLVRGVWTALMLSRVVRSLALLVPALSLLGLARSRRWVHLHVHSCADAAKVALLCRQLGGPGYSLTLHGPLADYGPDQQAKWGSARFGIVITRKLLGEVRTHLKQFGPERIYVAPMGVDLHRFSRPGPYEPWRPESGGAVKLFCCARLNAVKGHAELVRAAATLKQLGYPVRLRIAGTDDQGGIGYRTRLEALVRQLHADDGTVELLGAVDEQRVVSELHGAHLFVLASHHEPLGVAIMEAMAAGVPVVATDAGGVTELATDGVTAALVPPRDIAALVSGIRRVLDNPGLAMRLSDAGRVNVTERFHPGVSAGALARGVRESLSGEGASTGKSEGKAA